MKITHVMVVAILAIGTAKSTWAATKAELSVPVVGKLPIPTQMHGTAVVGDRLYIIGGQTSAGWTNAVHSAPIGSDDVLGPWRPEPPLPVMLAWLNNCIEVINDRIYICGGRTATSPDQSDLQLPRNDLVYWTSVQADGTLDNWNTAKDYPGEPMSMMSTCSDSNRLFVTGGSTRSDVYQTIYVADVAESGDLTTWRQAGQLPVPLWYHGSAILENRLYVWGGLISKNGSSQVTLDIAPTNSGVWSAEISSTGLLEPWRPETSLDHPTFSGAAAGFNDYLISVGGRYTDKSPTNTIWFSRLNDTKAGPWMLTRTDLHARVYHSLGMDTVRGRVFVTGGQLKTAPGKQPVKRLDTVQAFVIPQPDTSRLSDLRLGSEADSSTSGAAPQTPASRPLPPILAQARLDQKPILVLFYSPNVPACRRFFDSVMRTPEFTDLTRNYHLAMVDVSGSDAPLGPEYGIYRVPAMVVLTPDGEHRQRSINLRTLDDVRSLLTRPPPDKVR